MRVVVAGFVVLFGAVPALAYSTGPPSNHTGESGVSCTQCHGSNSPAPTMTVTGLEGPFAAGDTASITLTVTRVGDTTGAAGQCAGTRCAGFEASTDTGGTFAVTDTGTKLASCAACAANDNQVEHNARRPFDGNGEAVFTFDLTNLQGGDHTLYVAANDVNGNGTSVGDRVGLATFTFSVTPGAGEGEGEGEGGAGEGEGEGGVGEGEGEGGAGGEGEGEGEGDTGGGCSATSTDASAPLGAALLGLALVTVRVRSRRK